MKKNKGKLYMIPVPVAEGTVDSVLSPQIKEIIPDIKYFLVENLRTARRFIGSLKTGVVIEDLVFVELHKRTREEELRAFFKQISDDQDVGVMSEAGCPGIADPGALAAGFAHKQGREVVPLTGPSAILLSIMASGFSGQSFCFHGYLPINRAERIKRIKVLDRQSLSGQTQVFMETPFRNNHMLQDILENCSSETRLCIASNMTAPDQFIRMMKIAEWKKQVPDLHKKPTVFLFGQEQIYRKK